MQTKQTRQLDSQPAHSAPLAGYAARPPRGRIALALALAAFGSSAALLLTGCPANLENPERFDDAGAMATTDPNAAPVCLTQAFGKVCAMAGCHDVSSTTLNLQSPDVASRIVNVTARHALVDPTMCPTAKYIDTTTPANSWILVKLSGMQGSCGSPMPEGGNWTSDDMTCLKTWIQTLSMGSGAGGSGAGGGAATTGGSGGAATTSGGSGGAPAAGGAGGAATGGGGAGGTANGASGSAGTGGA